MKLVSLNAWGGNLFEALSAYLVAMRPGIMLLQEVTWAVDPSPDRLYFTAHGFDLPQKSDLFAALTSLLPDYQAQFIPATQGHLPDKNGGSFLSRFGLASFVHRDFAILAQAQDYVHGSFHPDSWGTPPVARSMHVLRLADPASGRPFTVAHTHGLRDPSGKHDTPARRAQAVRIVELLGRVRQKGDPTIFCGDLNLLPDSETFGVLKGVGLTDLVTTRGFTDTRTSLYEKPQRYADYLLVTPEVDVIAFDVPGEPVVSDHRPLVLEFEV